DIGSSDVFAAQQNGIDANKLVVHIVAVTGIVPIVNPKLGVDNLSMSQLRDIFAGKITNWKEVGGPDEKITVINRASGSGTRLAFEQVVMDGQETMKAQEQDSNGTVKQIVSNVPGAISYVSSAYLNDQVKALTIDHVIATSEN
ncbi:substrate-binding domain-containing protein, partial [Fructilactobacillus fructivorans]|uniref:substrate-binding domain-containing protein n=1 Tax=Fructilactobacillus fructivorans TaxID=1614 RepID=UPI000E36E899